MTLLHHALWAFFATSVLFWVHPALDIQIAAWFFTPDAGFYAASVPVLQLLRDMGQYAVWVGAMLCGVLLLHRAYRYRAALCLAVLAIGPGLLVNVLFKNQWGRARPVQLLYFGADKEFTPVWHISQECVRNCSFISGESAAAFWLLALVLLLCPARWQRIAMIVVLLWACGMALLRMMFGGHFASDVILAALLSIILSFGASILLARGRKEC